MKRRKRKLRISLILSLILFFLISYFVFFYRFQKIIIEPVEFKNDLLPYFQNKSPYQVFLNSKQITAEFPEIKKINIKSNLLQQKLEIKILTSKIIAKICDQKQCFYLDNFAEIIAPKKQQTPNLLIYSFLPIEKNTLLNPDIKNFLALVFEYANWKPLILKEIKIYSNFDIGIIDNLDREFLFDPSRDIEEQIKKLHIFLTKNFTGKRIDLRITKKIYFK
jgi:hypothetical protein